MNDNIDVIKEETGEEQKAEKTQQDSTRRNISYSLWTKSGNRAIK